MDRNYAIDFIKFFAIVAVVIIHTFPSNHLLGFFFLDNFSRFAVPFFFTASGYLFGLKTIQTPVSYRYFRKYLFKILKIYVCWLIFYILYDVIRAYSEGSTVAQTDYFKDLTLLNVLYYGQGTSGYQLWFVISLAWSISVVYLFFRLKKIRLLLIVSLCLNLAGLFGQSYSIFYELPVHTSRDALFIGLFYTTAGFWMALGSPFAQLKALNKRTSFYLFCLFSGLQAAEGYLLEKGLSARHGEYFLSTIFLTVFLFLFALQFKQLGKGLWITKIGGNALGIYAIHILFIDIVDMLLEAAGLGHISHNLFWNMLDALLVFTLSYAAYQFLQHAKKRLGVAGRAK
jgi:surface polysaccharide O-acyltransferase-like enzyme